MAEQKSMKKQLTFWLPSSWKNPASTPQTQPPKPSIAQTSNAQQPETQSKTPPQAPQLPPSTQDVAASEIEPVTKSSPSPTVSQPQPQAQISRKNSRSSSTSDVAPTLTRTRSQRPSPSRGASVQPSPMASPASRTKSAERPATQKPSPSREVKKGSSQPNMDTQKHEVTREATETPLPSSEDASGVLLEPQVNDSSQLEPLESEPPAKALEPKVVPTQQENEALDKDESHTKPTLNPIVVENQPMQELEPRSLPPDSVEKTTLAKSDPLTDSTRDPLLEINHNGIRDVSARNQEVEHGVDSSDAPNLERKIDQTKELIGGTYQDKDSFLESQTPDVKSEHTKQTKPLSKESSDSKPRRLDPFPTKTMKLVSISEREQPQTSSAPIENERMTAQSGCKKKEVRTTNPSNSRGSTSQEERISTLRGIKNDISKFAQNLGIGYSQQTEGERSVFIITLAGDNKGASMVIGRGTTSEGSIPIIHKAYNLSQENGEAEHKHEEKTQREKLHHERYGAQPIKANINSNTQSINNSILQNSSCSETNPGVYFILNNEPRANKHAADNQPLTQKSKSNMTPTQKLSTEPTPIVRRRCLRGLFAESSESDPENPKKPQRHGCRFRCE